MSRKKRKRVWRWLLAFVALAGVFWYFKDRIFPKVKLRDRNYVFIYVEPKDLLEDISSALYEEELIKDQNTFEWLAERMKLPDNIHPGRYRVTNGMNVRQIINLIKYGKEEKVRLSLNSQIRDLDEFVAYVDEKLAMPENEIRSILEDERKLQELFGLTPETALALVVPGIMDVSWASSADDFFKQMSVRYKKVYNQSRIAQAKQMGFDLHEVQVLASIVQSESAIASEQKKIAGVYINRLKRNMPLQADPTLKYACRNFDLQRILDKDKEIDSPYNTYRNKGLPPGPICLVSVQALDATLNYTRHRYLYFCAKPDLRGYSDFSVTYDEHRRRAVEYRRALDRRGIMR